MVKWLNAIAFHSKLISELRSVTRRTGSHLLLDTVERSPF